MIEYPHLIFHKGKMFMLYNGNNYGKDGFGLAINNEKKKFFIIKLY